MRTGDWRDKTSTVTGDVPDESWQFTSERLKLGERGEPHDEMISDTGVPPTD